MEYYTRYLKGADTMAAQVGQEKTKHLFVNYLTRCLHLLRERVNSDDHLLQYGNSFGEEIHTEATRFMQKGLLRWVMRVA
jgi:hypothetical protein